MDVQNSVREKSVFRRASHLLARHSGRRAAAAAASASRSVARSGACRSDAESQCARAAAEWVGRSEIRARAAPQRDTLSSWSDALCDRWRTNCIERGHRRTGSVEPTKGGAQLWRCNLVDERVPMRKVDGTLEMIMLQFCEIHEDHWEFPLSCYVPEIEGPYGEAELNRF